MNALVKLSFLIGIVSIGFISELKAQVAAAPGTYQFRCTDIKAPLDVFTNEVLYTIESNRDSVDVRTIWVGANMKVKILPYSQILAPGFVPLSDDIVFEKLSDDIYNENGMELNPHLKKEE